MYLDPGQGAPELGHNPPKQGVDRGAKSQWAGAVEEQNMHTRISKQQPPRGSAQPGPGL